MQPCSWAPVSPSLWSAAIAVVIFMLEQRAYGVPVSAQGPWWRISSSEYLFEIALYCVALLAACMIRNLIEMQ